MNTTQTPLPIRDTTYENRKRYVIKAFVPVFVQRPEAHIVNIWSMGGFLPAPGQPAYGSPKAAVSSCWLAVLGPEAGQCVEIAFKRDPLHMMEARLALSSARRS